MNKLTLICVSVIVGSVLTVASYFSYVVFQVRKQTIINTSNIAQIVDYLNKATSPKE